VPGLVLDIVDQLHSLHFSIVSLWKGCIWLEGLVSIVPLVHIEPRREAVVVSKGVY